MRKNEKHIYRWKDIAQFVGVVSAIMLGLKVIVQMDMNISDMKEDLREIRSEFLHAAHNIGIHKKISQ